MESIAEIIIRCTPHAILAMDTNLAILQVNDAFCQLFGQPSSSELTGKPASSIVDVT
ncbi:PAS domain-containing protein, partial [uncultured Merdimmobilis sp.]